MMPTTNLRRGLFTSAGRSVPEAWEVTTRSKGHDVLPVKKGVTMSIYKNPMKCPRCGSVMLRC
jgi:hypothetical protein